MEINETKIPLKNKISSLKLAMKYIWKSSRTLTIIQLIFSVVAGLFIIVGPLILKLIIDYLTNMNISTVTSVSLGVIGLLVLYGLSEFIQNMIGECEFLLRISQNYRLEKNISRELMKKASTLDIEYFEDAEFYDNLYKATSNIYRVTDTFKFVLNNIRLLISVIAIIISLMVYDWKISLLIIIGAIPNLIVSLKFADISYDAFSSASPVRRKASYYLNILGSNKRAAKEIKLFSLSSVFLKKWDSLFKNVIKLQDNVVKKQIKLLTLAKFFSTIFIVMAMILSINLFISGKITIGVITFLFALIFRFSNKLGYFFEGLGYLNENLSYLDSIQKVFNYKPKINNSKNGKKMHLLKKGIEFRNVFFKYPKTKKYVLKNINLKIKPGQNIAIVGENGCGKTTFIKLLTRLYDVTSGEILLDGINVKDYSLNSLYKNIGVIFQDFVQYEAKVKENIKFSNPKNNSNQSVHNSAKKSDAYSFIKLFDNKYNEHLGKMIHKNGKELSGGQWQKIALSRAFFKDSQILILDEPTAAIDAKAEANLFNKFKKLTKGKTTILISHRFSTVRMADMIVVMDHGNIIEIGTHDDLIKSKGVYYNLFNLQAEAYK